MNLQHQIKISRTLIYILVAIMFFKIGGYFTLSESLAVTRLIKIVLRLSMTLAIFMLYRRLTIKGYLSSFSYENMLVPFFYGLYLLLAFASLLWTSEFSYSLLQLTMNLETFVFAYIFIKAISLLNQYHPDKQIRISKIIGTAIFLILIIFLIGKYINPDKFFRQTHGGEVSRLGGQIMNPNELGMLAVIEIAFYFIEIKNKLNILWNLCMSAAALYALVLTGSRSSMIGFMLVALILISKSKSTKLKISAFIIAGLSIPIIINMIFIKVGDISEVLSMTGRLPFWKALITAGLPKAPFLGFGYMRIAYTDYFESVHSYAARMTHNTFIQVLMNLCFIGLTIVLLQVTFTLRAYFKSQSKEIKTIFVGLFIPLIINSFTEFGIFGEANFGILFYQLIIFMFVIKYNPKFSTIEKIKLKLSFPTLVK